MLDKIFRPIVFPLLAAIIWGTAFVNQDIALKYIPPLYLNVFRCIIACFFLGIIIPIMDKRNACNQVITKAAKENERKLLIKSGIVCGAIWFIAQYLQQYGMVLGVEASKAGFLTALYVVLVPLLGVLFFHKKAPKKVYFCALLAAIALFFICIKDGLVIEKKDSIEMLSALFFALHILFIDRYVGFVNSIKFHFSQIFCAGIFSCIFALLFEEFPSIETMKACSLEIFSLGFLSTCVAFLLQIEAQKCQKATLVTILLSMESVFATIFGCIILNQFLTAKEAIGCSLMFAAVILSQLPSKSKT